MPQAIEKCRICDNSELVQVLDLGEQVLTGVFPAEASQNITRGPLQLVKCMGEGHCGLLQLAHSYDLDEMYGENYGYRSGLNKAMVAHLDSKIRRIRELYQPEAGGLIIDIGSNDSTTLQSWPEEDYTLVGIDPTGVKFSDYYPEHIRLIPDFFSAQLFRQHFPDTQAAVVTSFSMFYDLPAPMAFMRDVHEILEDGGLWIFEQSYMPTMLAMNSYDTACHEHLEYYAMRQIAWMAERVGFSLLEVELNDVNGGSFSVTAQKSKTVSHGESVKAMLEKEVQSGLDGLEPYRAFADRVAETREQLQSFFDGLEAEGKRCCALGASTKGNVLLQYCDITTSQLPCVGEVNADKFGKFTPGTLLPIVPESEALAQDFDYYLVLPWHFRSFFESADHLKDKTLVFPLPEITIVPPRQGA